MKSFRPRFYKLLTGVILAVTFAIGLTGSPATAATSSTLNFQARLLTSSGALAPDGNYNISFHIFDQQSGSSGSTDTACGTDTHCLWSETYTVAGSNAVRVAGGYLSVQLGSSTAFPSTINWDQQLYLTMDIGGVLSSPTWDGQMLSSSNRLPLTGVPYAFRAGALAATSGANITTLTLQAPSASGVTFIVPNTGTSASTQYNICTSASSTTCSDFAAATSGSGYIQNQVASLQQANFKIQSAASGSVTATIEGASGQSVDILDVATTSNNVLTIGSGGAATFQNTTDSSTGFAIKNSGGTSILNVDTSNLLASVTNLQATGTISLQNGQGASIQLRTASASSTGLTESNVITDSTPFLSNNLSLSRSAGLQGDGRQPPDSSTGIWETTTNMFTNGGFEGGTSGWTTSSANTTSFTSDTSTAKFGSASAKAVVNASGVSGIRTTGTALTSGQPYAVSAWVKGTAGKSLVLQLVRADFSTIVAQTSFTATGAWQYITATTSSYPATETAYVYIKTTAAGADSFWADGVQLENKNIPTPYVETNGGTATRSPARVQAPSSVLNSTQGWVAMRLRMDYAYNALPDGSGLFPHLFTWGDSSTSDIRLRYNSDNTGGTTAYAFSAVRESGGGSAIANIAQSSAQSFNAGDMVTVVAYWISNNIYISVNGSNFVAAPSGNTTIPTIAASNFDIGTGGTIFTTREAESDVLWTATGTGTLSNTDAANLYKLGNSDPSISGLNSIDSASTPTLAWDGASTQYSGTNADYVNNSQISIDDVNLTHTGNGALTLQGSTNSTTAFQVQDSSGAAMFTVDTSTSGVTVGSNAKTTNFVTIDTGTGATLAIGNSTTAHIIQIGTNNSASQAVSLGANSAGSVTTIEGGAAASSGAINIGTSNVAHTIGIGNTGVSGTQAITIGGTGNSANTVLIQGGSGTAVSVQAASTGTIALGTLSSTTISVGTGAFAHTIAIGTDGTTNQGISIGSATAGSTFTAEAGTGTTNLFNGNTAHTVQLATGAAAESVTIGSTNTTSGTTISAGTNNLNLTANGSSSSSIIAKTSVANSTLAFQVQNAVAAPIFVVDTTSTDNSGATVNYLSYPGFESGLFNNAVGGWNAVAPATLAQNSNKLHAYNGLFSAQIGTTSSNGGLTTSSFAATPTTGTYIISFYAKVSSGTMDSAAFTVQTTDGATHTCSPVTGTTINSNGFQRIYCTITTTGTITAFQITQNDGVARTIYIDSVQLQKNAINGNTITAPSAYQVGAIQLRGVITNPVVIQNAANSTSAFQVLNSAGTSVLNVDTLNGNTTIGSSNLYQTIATPVLKGAADATGNNTTVGVGGGGVGNEAFNDVAYYGKYIYVAKAGDNTPCSSTPSGLGCELQIYDATNPSLPVYVGGVDSSGTLNSGTDNTAFNGLAISGHYLYVAKAASATNCNTVGNHAGCELQVYDISNPVNPAYVGGADASGGTNTGTTSLGFNGISISGNYAFIASANSTTACSSATATGCELKVFNISNPANPAYVGGADESGTTNSGTIGTVAFNKVRVFGRYAYVANVGSATDCSTAGNAVGCELQVYDVSNPATPIFASGIDASGTNNSVSGVGTGAFDDVAVSGRYVYVAKAGNATACSNTVGSAAGCETQIYDFSNPSSPAYIAGIDSTGAVGSGTGGQSGNNITISGKYAYISMSGSTGTCSSTNATGCELQEYDISNPNSPVYQTGMDATGVQTGLISVGDKQTVINGRYLYMVRANSATDCATANNASGCELQIFDISGVDAVSVNAGSIYTGTLTADQNAIFNQSISINGGATVGQNLQVNGDAGFGGSVWLQNDVNSTNAFQVQNAAAVQLFNADTTNLKLTANQSTVVVTGMAAPTGQAVSFVSNTVGNIAGVPGTTYFYKVTALNAAGESLASGEVSIAVNTSFTKLPAPSAPSGSPTTGSDLGVGNYLYELTVVTPEGESLVGTESATVTTTSGNQDVTLTVPVVPTGATGFKVYRTLLNGGSGSEALVTAGGCSGVITTTCTDNATDGQVTGAPPGASTAFTDLNETQISWTAVANATSYKIYRGTATGAENVFQTTTASPFLDTSSTGGSAGSTPTRSSIGQVGIGVAAPTANLDVAGTVHFENSLNSTTAFTVQNSAGVNYIAVDTSGANLNLGATSTTSENVAINNSSSANTGTITLGGSGSSGTITINQYTGGSASTVNIANAATTGNATVNILSGVGTAGTSAVHIADNTRVNTITIGNIAPAAARTTTIAGGNSGVTDTVNIATGNATVAGGKTVHIADGTPSGSGTNLVTIGSITALANTTLIQGGNGGTAIQLQAATSGTISIGTTNVNTVTVGSTANTGTLTFGQSTAGETINISNGATAANTAVNILSGVGTAGTATLKLADNTRATQIDLGNINPAAARTINIGNSTVTANAAVDTINIATNPTTVAGGNTIHIADGTPTGSGTNIVAIGSNSATASTTTIKGGTGTGAITLSANGGGSGNTGTVVTTVNNSTLAFQVQNASSQAVFTADTTHQQVAVGPAAVPANGVLTVGTSSTTTASGGIYFGTDTDLYRNAANALRTDGSLSVVGNTTQGFGVRVDPLAAPAFSGLQTASNTLLANKLLAADANYDFAIGGDGKIQFGAGGASALDITISRSGTGNLQIQPATGLTQFNAGSVDNEIRIYGSGGSNYASLSYNNASSSAILTTNSGTVKVGSGSGPINITSGSSAAITITANASSTWQTLSGTLTLQAGSGLILNSNTTATHDVTISDTSTTALQIQNASASNVFVADTTNMQLLVGNTNPNTSTSLSYGTSNNYIYNTIASDAVVQASDAAQVIIGSDGYARILYNNTSGSNWVLLTCHDTPCSNPSVTQLSGITNAGDAHMAIGSDGYVRYVGTDNSEHLILGVCSNANCTSATTHTVDSSETFIISENIALTSGNLPMIGIAATGNGLRLAECTTTDCSSGITLSTLDATQTSYVQSMVLNSSGYPQILYAASSATTLKIANCPNAACTGVNLATIGTNGEVWGGMVLGSDGFPRIAWNASAGLTYVKCTVATCASGSVTNTVDSSSQTGYLGVSLALDSSGNAHIAYDDFPNRQLKYAVCGDASCSTGNTVSVLDSTYGAGENPGIAMDSTATYPRIAYYYAGGINGNYIKYIAQNSYNSSQTASGVNVGKTTSNFANIYIANVQAGFFTLKPTADSSTAFQIQNASGTNLFIVDTVNNQITLGTATANPVQLVLGSKNTSGDPAGLGAACNSGALYYNASSNFFRACDNNTWGSVAVGDQTVGYVLPPSGSNGLSTGGFSGTTSAWFSLFNQSNPMTINTVTFRVTAVTTNGSLNFAIYNAATRQQVATWTYASSGTGVKNMLLASPLYLPAGTYYFAVVAAGCNITAQTILPSQTVDVSPSNTPEESGSLTVVGSALPSTIDGSTLTYSTAHILDVRFN